MGRSICARWAGLPAAAQKTGIPAGTLAQRVSRLGVDVDAAVGMGRRIPAAARRARGTPPAEPESPTRSTLQRLGELGLGTCLAEVLGFMRAHQEARGVFPTFQQMARGLNITWGALQERLRRLDRLGYTRSFPVGPGARRHELACRMTPAPAPFHWIPAAPAPGVPKRSVRPATAPRPAMTSGATAPPAAISVPGAPAAPTAAPSHRPRRPTPIQLSASPPRPEPPVRLSGVAATVAAKGIAPATAEPERSAPGGARDARDVVHPDGYTPSALFAEALPIVHAAPRDPGVILEQGLRLPRDPLERELVGLAWARRR